MSHTETLRHRLTGAAVRRMSGRSEVWRRPDTLERETIAGGFSAGICVRGVICLCG